MVGSALQAKFSGPYAIDRKLSETDYVIQTPDCKKKTCVCQINMLKACTDREDSVQLTTCVSELCAFVTPDHFLQYTVMPFGLRNAPATFQWLMNTVLCGVRNCDIYLDDIVAYSSTWSKHLDTLREVLRTASLTLNLTKCEFGKAMVTYLVKQVGQGCVSNVSAKVQAILDFPAPQMRCELCRFLGMAGYYRAFCKN